MPKRDFYDVLGVARTATADEIRKAYRNLARKFHPDVNKDPDAAKRFNEVQEAYDVLADEQKRKAYDQFGHAGPGFAGAAGPGGARPHYSWSNVGAPGGAHGVDFDVEDMGSMFEAFFGGRGGPGEPGFGGMGGTAGRAARARKAHPVPQPPVEHELHITFLTAARGGTEHLRLAQPDGRTRQIEVRIPKATTDGARLRVRGGADGSDLILQVRIGPHPIFRRSEFPGGPQGLDLYLDLPLTIAEATLGTQVPVPTLDGSVEIKVPPGTSSGMKLRIRGKGLEDERGKTGDLYAIVKIMAPAAARLSPEETALLQQIADRGGNPRADWPT